MQLAGMNPRVDSLIPETRQCIEQLADPRRYRNSQYRFSDIAMAAFSVLFMQSLSFLSHQRRMAQGRDGDSCAASLIRMARIPYDNHIHRSLDGFSPRSFYKWCTTYKWYRIEVVSAAERSMPVLVGRH